MIPTPHRSAPAARPSPSRLVEEEPVELGEDDAVQEPRDLYEDAELDAPSTPRARASARPKKKPIRRTNRDPDAPNPILAIVGGVLGLIAVIVAILIVDGFTRNVLIAGFANVLFKHRRFSVFLMVLICGVATWGLACFLRVIRPTAGTNTREGSHALAGAIMTVLVLSTIGLRLYRGAEPPSLLLNAFDVADRIQNGTGELPQRDFADEEARRTETQRLTSELVNPDLERRIAAAEALARIKPIAQDGTDGVRPWIHKLLSEGGRGKIAAIHALGRWGDGSDDGYLEILKRDKDPEVAKAATEAYKVAKSGG